MDGLMRPIFVLAFIDLFFSWAGLTLLGMLSSILGGNKGPEEKDVDDLELGLRRGMNCLR